MNKGLQVSREGSLPVNSACEGCGQKAPLPIAITMAFQPIYDFSSGRIFAYEALVRGKNGESAAEVLAAVKPDMLYKFDQECRVEAIRLAGRLFPADSDTKLSINFLPNAVYEPASCIRASMLAAKRAQFCPSRLMFEFTENEKMLDVAHVQRIVDAYRELGFTTAIDDFGAGYSGLNLLADLNVDLLKVDMLLIRGIDQSKARQAIVRRIVQLSGDLKTRCIVEGVETPQEFQTLRNLGVELIQGYFLAKPMVEALPEVNLTDIPQLDCRMT